MLIVNKEIGIKLLIICLETNVDVFIQFVRVLVVLDNADLRVGIVLHYGWHPQVKTLNCPRHIRKHSFQEADDLSLTLKEQSCEQQHLVVYSTFQPRVNLKIGGCLVWVVLDSPDAYFSRFALKYVLHTREMKRFAKLL